MKLDRLFTRDTQRPYEGLTFERRGSKIQNPDGKVVFEVKDIQIPQGWSQVAVDIMAQKYFRKAGVPSRLRRVPEEGVPEWLWRSEPDEQALAELPPAERTCGEKDSRQLFNRLAGCWTYWGWKYGYFADEPSARAFFEELVTIMASQRVAPNSPQWFNTGLHWAYGITGPAQGHSYCDAVTGELHAQRQRLRAPAAARLLHPVRRRRPRRRQRHHGSVDPRGSPL
jgi:ribonucleoside-diphosphate reductase alpha chain